MLTFKRSLGALSVTSAISLALGGCGGGGGSVNSMPPPAPSPTPPPSSAAVAIFPNPAAQTFASAGASASGGFSGSQPIGQVSSGDVDQPHIRYTSGGLYEIELPGKTWDRLIPHSGISPPSMTEFQPQSSDLAYFIISDSKASGYQYSELAAWADPGSNRYGAVAFGAATLPGQVPVTGSSTYSGIVNGSSDVINSNSFDGSYRVPVSGTVDLGFDFAKGTLDGSISLNLNDYSPATIGTFAFKDTVFRSEARPIPASSPLRRRGRIISWGNSPVRMRKRRSARGRCPSFSRREAAP